ncbi:MAG: hypothetical protein WCP69_15625 [Bacteroidota bacterium]
MKKFFTILIAVFLTSNVFSQVPQKMSYQAVIRNSSNALVISTTVGMKISILQGSATGTVVYTETKTPTTNANGLVSIEIGGGAGFSTINWANNVYFIKTETDPAGGTNYTITGTSQLLSVPYALHAKTAETVTGGISETDPIFVASPANGITATNISYWTTAYGWGNHATAGYLTNYAETDPLYISKFDVTGSANGDLLKFNGTKYVKFTPNFLTSYTETDPIYLSKFDVTGAANGDLLKFNGTKYVKFTPNFLTSYTETDPIYISKFDVTGAAIGDLLKFDGTKYVKFTPNYAVNTHSHTNATTTVDGFMSSTDKTRLDGLQNANITAGTGISVTGTYPNLTITNTATASGTHYLGEEYLNGIIFYLYISGGVQHGLVVSKTESTGYWSGTAIVGANRTEDGAFNTALMPTGAGTARNLVTALGAGWYLPSIDELGILWHNRFHVNKTARAISATVLSNGTYWSSTEWTATNAFNFYFYDSVSGSNLKTDPNIIRGIRAF